MWGFITCTLHQIFLGLLLMDGACRMHGKYDIINVQNVGHLAIPPKGNIQRKDCHENQFFVTIINNKKQILPSVDLYYE
jgi:hypothetical protein